MWLNAHSSYKFPLTKCYVGFIHDFLQCTTGLHSMIHWPPTKLLPYLAFKDPCELCAQFSTRKAKELIFPGFA